MSLIPVVISLREMVNPRGGARKSSILNGVRDGALGGDAWPHYPLAEREDYGPMADTARVAFGWIARDANPGCAADGDPGL
jgi:hypothetical protein